MPQLKRSLVIKIASGVTALAMIASLAAVIVTRVPSSHAGTSIAMHKVAQKVTLLAKGGSGALTAKGKTAGHIPTRANTQKTHEKNLREIERGKPIKSNPAAPVVAPIATPATRGAGPLNGQHIPEWNGLSELDNDFTNGFEVSPPDQGLCVGDMPAFATSDNPGGKDIVWEMINETIAAYDPNGSNTINGQPPSNTPLFEASFGTFFGDNNSFGDPRCLYDPTTHLFYFTNLSTPLLTGTGTNSGADLLIINGSGAFVEYYVDFTDTSAGCPCLGDQVRIGFDNNGIYLSADEYPFFGPGVFGQNYNGSAFYAISKADLIAGSPSPVAYYADDLIVDNTPVLGLVPAQSWSSSTNEWMVNSLPYDQVGNNNNIADNLDVWKSSDNNIETTAPTVTVSIINTETYAYPIEALSTPGTTPGFCNSSYCVAAINPDDDRVDAVEYLNGHVYTSFVSAVVPKGSSITVDGAAWFDIKAQSSSPSISLQGYLAYQNQNIVYPAFWVSPNGTGDIIFTLTSPSLNPTAAAVYRTCTTCGFSGAHLAQIGSTPSTDFTYRWGDYSWAAPDPDNGDIWLATEYVPNVLDQGFFANWGTFVFRH